MKKVNKRSILSLVLCAMLVFCVGFYSTAKPTTSWFYAAEKLEEAYKMQEVNVVFEDFAGNEISSVETQTLNFKAATKLSDSEERANMFEHAAEFYVFSAENTGDFPAHIEIDIWGENVQGDIMTSAVSGDSGIRYFIYELDVSEKSEVDSSLVDSIFGNEVPNGGTVLQDGEATAVSEAAMEDVYVNKESGLRVLYYNGKYYYTQLSSKLFSNITDETDLSTVENEKTFLQDAVDVQATHLDKDEKKVFCICMWVDYDAFVDDANSTVTGGVRTLECNVDIRLQAVQHVEQATTTAAPASSEEDYEL